jgi:glutamate-1-semialdehyde 2,1-aminomutase
MERVSPAGSVYQAGTLSGNPLAVNAGITTLEILRRDGTYELLEQRAAALERGLLAAAADRNVPITLNRVGSMLTVFFTRQPSAPVTNFLQATAGDTQAYARFFHAMLDNGIYLPPSQYEAWFVGLAHTDEIITRTTEAADAAFASTHAQDLDTSRA